LDNWGSIPGRGNEGISFSSLHPDWFLGPTCLLSCGYWEGGKADHLPPSSAKVKNVWKNTSTHPYVFMTLPLVKPRTHRQLEFATWESNECQHYMTR